MKIASQDAQANVAHEPEFRPIATTCQAVTRLQRADGRFDPGVSLARLVECDRGFLILLCRLPSARFRQARLADSAPRPAA